MVKMEPSSGNIFADLGFDAEEAENLLLRSRLMLAIDEYIREENITQSEAAGLLQVSQSRVSDIKRGKINRFTVDSLVAMLSRLGKTIEITIADKAA